ncbi:MAG: Spy/CpxP family protein refolding chaperone [Limisphaerales bacterium]
MKQNIFPAVLVAALSASFLCAQPAGGTTPTPPTPAQIAARQVARLTKLLDLTTAQQASATTIFTTEQTALAALAPTMNTAQASLETAVLANNSADIAAAATQIGTLTTERVTDEATANAAFYAILTPDQQTKYTNLKLGTAGAGAFGGHAGGHWVH